MEEGQGIPAGRIPYVYQRVVCKYRPDSLVRLTNGTVLVFEVEGKGSAEEKTKRRFLREQVKAVNMHGGSAYWRWAVSQRPADADGILGEKSRV